MNNDKEIKVTCIGIGNCATGVIVEMTFNITGMFPIACVILDALAARASMIDHFTLTAVSSTRKTRKNRRKNRNQ